MSNGVSAAHQTDQRLALVETALAVGAVLIIGDFGVDIPEIDSVGVCAWGALNRFARDRDLCVDLAADEYDAIEMGWDDERDWLRDREAVTPWWELGARLAARFQPVSASDLGEASR